MSYHETQYPHLLGGVSQVEPSTRPPGRVSEQINMFADSTLGLRRRHPFEIIRRFSGFGGLPQPDPRPRGKRFFRLQVDSDELLACITPSTGGLELLAADTGQTHVINVSADATEYLRGSVATEYQVAYVGSEAFILNTDVTPEVVAENVAGKPDPSQTGFFTVVSGQLNTRYKVTVRNTANGQFVSGSYTTPDGTGTNDAVNSSAGYIAASLMDSLDADLTSSGYTWLVLTSPFEATPTQIFLADAPIEVTTEATPTQIVTSGRSNVRVVSDLPVRLPPSFDGYRVRVGGESAATYYEYSADDGQWLESSSYDAYERISSIAVRVGAQPGQPYFAERLDSLPRPAGDRESNPTFKLTERVTGIASYRGRLVILAGGFVCMSAAGQPAQWFRSTVTDLIDSDPIEVAEASEQAASYRQAVPLSGGLLITSPEQQAWVYNDGILSPSTARIVPLSRYSLKTSIPPVSMGSAVLLPFSREGGVASDGLYYASIADSIQPRLNLLDLSQEVPNYLGEPEHWVASTTSGTLFGIDRSNRVVLYQFAPEWADEEANMNGWHSWEIVPSGVVHYGYVIGNKLYLVVATVAYDPMNDSYYRDYTLGSIDISHGQNAPHHLDFHETFTLNNASGATFSTRFPSSVVGTPGLCWFATSGEFANLGGDAEWSGTSRNWSVEGDLSLTGDVVAGYPYESSVSPSPPVVRDRSSYALRKERVTLVKFTAHVEDSGPFQATVSDRVHTFDMPDLSVTANYLPSEGNTATVGSGFITIPARTRLQDTQLTLSTTGFYELNITALEYGFKLQPQHRRV